MEGHNKCTTREKIISKTCTIKYTLKNDVTTYCTLCYSSAFTGTKEVVEPPTPLHEMISILHDMGHEVNRSDEQEDIRDLFEHYNTNKADIIFNETLFDKNIIYPINTSTYLDSLTVLLEFNLNKRGSFLCNNSLTKTHQLDIIELFAGLVNLKQNNSANNNQIDKLYKVLPKGIVRFAEESRLNNAYRLLRQTIRHANDPMFPAITTATTKIFTYKQKIGLYVKHSVRASMNPQQYRVEVAFTNELLLSCRCSCCVGCCNTGGSLCVHILPVIYKLTQTLYQGLGEHLLVNFQSQIQFIEIEELTEDKRFHVLITCYC